MSHLCCLESSKRCLKLFRKKGARALAGVGQWTVQPNPPPTLHGTPQRRSWKWHGHAGGLPVIHGHRLQQAPKAAGNHTVLPRPLTSHSLNACHTVPSLQILQRLVALPLSSGPFPSKPLSFLLPVFTLAPIQAKMVLFLSG